MLDEGLPLHPLQEQRDSVKDWRQIGLGVMGAADMLIKLGLRYGSEEAIDMCRKVSMAMANIAIHESACLAEKYGPYPKYNESVLDTPFFKANVDTFTKCKVETYGLRNSQLLTIAPTGTLSTMLGVSGGMEPIFAKSYKRKTESLHGHDEYYDVLTPIYQQYADEHGLSINDQFPDWFVDSSEIAPEQRVMMQAAWQQGIDASISSTVNLPHDATIEDVENIYMWAWKHGLKGITIYRAGCMREGILTTDNGKHEDDANDKPEVLPRGAIVECSNDLVGKKRKVVTGCGSLHIAAFFDPVDGSLQEVYLAKGSTGGCGNFMTGLSRMISLLCRAGVDIVAIKDQLDSTGVCPSYATRTAISHDTSKGSCCPMAIGNALMDMWCEMQDDITDEADEPSNSPDNEAKPDIMAEPVVIDGVSVCPECGAELVREGGCVQCKSCGWSKCG